MKALNLDFWRKTVEHILVDPKSRIGESTRSIIMTTAENLLLQSSFSTNIHYSGPSPPIKHFCSIIGLKEGICRVHWQQVLKSVHYAMYSVQGARATEHVHCAMCSVQFGEWKLQCILLLRNIIQCGHSAV